MTEQQIRHIFHSTLTRNGWEVREGGETLSRHPDQQQCEAAAVDAARQIVDEGGLAQAVLHESDGTIRQESTFGRDRERIWTEPNGLMAEGVTWPEVQQTADGLRSRALTIHLPAIQAPANGRGLLGETAMSNSEENYTALTADIVSAYVANNSVQAGNVPALIESIHAAIAGLSAPPAPPVQQPAVNPKRSVHDDYIVCLEDGKKFKSLKRHLMALHDLTPEEYRAKWDLPRDYPMAAPNYAVKRSEHAKKMGLGRIPKIPTKGKSGKRA